MNVSDTTIARSRALPWIAIFLFLGIGAALSGAGYIHYDDSMNPVLLIVIGYFLYGIVLSLFMLVLSYGALRRLRARTLHGEMARNRATVVIPAYNEAAVIKTCVDSLLRQVPAVNEILVVNDGSTDSTFSVLEEAYGLIAEEPPNTGETRIYHSARKPALRVLDFENAGKAAALNAGLAHASGDIFITGDADSIFTTEAIERMLRYFEERPLLVAAGGVLAAGNGVPVDELQAGQARLPRGVLPKLQWIEYATGYVWRFGWSRLNSLLLLSGGFSAFRTEVLRDCGGFDTNSFTEDYEIAYRIHRYCRAQGRDYEIVPVPDPLVYTLVPETVSSFLQQRTRWFQGFLQTLLNYRRLVFKPRYGWLGVFALPLKWIDALTPIWATFSYCALAFHATTCQIFIPLCLLVLSIGLRITTDLITSRTLLSLNQGYIEPRLTRREVWSLAWLIPVNLWFQRAAWFWYSLNAYYRLARNSRRWDKVRHNGFAHRA
jgi:cellulose synthase/poly-beta-1,6-N-acetylglucosamine synthase-like glycosyltransferase